MLPVGLRLRRRSVRAAAPGRSTAASCTQASASLSRLGLRLAAAGRCGAGQPAASSARWAARHPPPGELVLGVRAQRRVRRPAGARGISRSAFGAGVRHAGSRDSNPPARRPRARRRGDSRCPGRSAPGVAEVATARGQARRAARGTMRAARQRRCDPARSDRCLGGRALAPAASSHPAVPHTGHARVVMIVHRARARARAARERRFPRGVESRRARRQTGLRRPPTRGDARRLTVGSVPERSAQRGEPQQASSPAGSHRPHAPRAPARSRQGPGSAA